MSRRCTRRISLILLIAWLIPFTLACSLDALFPDHFVVTKTEDTNDGECSLDDCSLREAVIAANDTPGRDEITIPAGNYILVLSTGSDETGGAGVGDLDITEGVLISGAGSDFTNISGGGIFQVFDVHAGGTVEVRSLTMLLGSAGIRIASGAIVKLDDLVIRQHAGPGIVNHGELSVNFTLIVENGLAADATEFDPAAEGGGIYNDGQITLHSVVIETNLAATGGAIHNLGGSVTLIRSRVEDNAAISRGGGILNDSGTMQIEDSILSNNRSYFGGGILNTGAGAELTILSSSIVRSLAYSDSLAAGGGILNQDGAWAYLEGVTLLENQSNTCGGGMYNNGAFFTIHSSTLALNTAPTGAGLCSDSSGTLNGPISDIVNSTFSGNVSPEEGAGIIVSGGTYHLINTTLADNQASAGGGIYITDGSVIMENTLLARNSVGNCAGLPPGSGDHNMEDVASCDLGMPSDAVNPNPGLGPLTDLGLTLMHPLLAGSPAIDAGAADVCPGTDQRGVTRPQGAGCDIGAYEVEDVQPRLVPTGTATFTLTWTPVLLPTWTWTRVPPPVQNRTATLPLFQTLAPILPSSTPVP